MLKRNSGGILILILAIIFNGKIQAQEKAPADNKPSADLNSLITDGAQEIDFYSLEELLDINVEVASLFVEDELVVGSTVSSIGPQQWNRQCARRLTDALENEPSVVSYYGLGGFKMTSIRGYTRDGMTNKGVVTLIDGIPIISFNNATNDGLPNFSLGTLDGIELIKGPGSAIYGSDAFHGVIALKTFESDKDLYSVEAAAACPLYADGSVKISQGLGDMFRLNLAGGYSSQIASEKLEYDYDTRYKPEDQPYPSIVEQDAEKGSSEYENRYKTATGILKLKIMPADKLNFNINGYAINNVFKDFPGLNESFFLQLDDKDRSSQESTLYILNASGIYTFNSKISVEAKGYYYYWDMVSTLIIRQFGDYSNYTIHENRCGADLIVKQPDNAFNLQWLFAYSFSHAKEFDSTVESFYENGDPFTPPYSQQKYDLPSNDKKRDINSLYSQLKWGVINKKLFLLAGGRLDNYSDAGLQLTPRTGIIFLPAQSTAIKALYGRAFMAGNGNAMYGIPLFAVGDREIKPETIDIYELIFLHKKKTCRISVNGFYSYWKNGIILEQNTTGSINPYEYTNSGKNRSYGGEAKYFDTFEPFAFDIGFSYVKSEALDALTNPSDSTSERKDQVYKAFPEYMIICGLYYHLKPLDIKFYLNNRIYLKMKRSTYPHETEDLPVFHRMDLNISKIISEKLELYLDVKNLTNRKNYTPSLYYPVFGAVDPDYKGTGVEPGIPEPGISVLLRAGYKL